jgi:hypothetical protein
MFLIQPLFSIRASFSDAVLSRLADLLAAPMR